MTAAGARPPLGRVLHAFDVLESTQAEAARLARAQAPEGAVVLARHQTGGRGRQGRAWWDAPGESLLFSVVLRPPIAAGEAPQLALVGGLAVSEALQAAAGVAARIRWPNDVLIEGRKACGILAEAASSPAGRVEHVILGVGINLNQTEFPADLARRATSLRVATGRRWDADALLGPVLDALERRYAAFLAGRFAALREAWRGRAATLGQVVETPDGQQGVAVDVDADGALLVRDSAGTLLRVVSGELAGEVRGDATGH